jgi:cytochrome P450 family 135
MQAMALPPTPTSSPRLQTLRWLFRPIAFMESCRREFGETFGLMFIGFETPLYFSSDPEAIRAVYSNRANGLPPGRNTTLEPIMGSRSVLLLEGQEHLSRRKLMLPPFHGERMRAYQEVIEEVISREVDSWPLHSAFPVHPRMQAVTLEVILRAVFGVTDEARLERLRGSLGKVLGQTAHPLMQLVIVTTQRFGARGLYGRFLELLEEVDAALYEEIADRREDPDLDQREDILSMLITARFEDGGAMDDRELRDQLMTLLLAGHETTATGLAWTLDMLARNPAASGRLREEVLDGGEDYLRATITESLRLRPVVPIAGRRLAEETEIDGYTLPAGADISPAIYLTHTRPDLYPDPYAFRPERFLESGPDTYGWVPFGGGIRRCLGAAFAEFEMRIVLKEVVGRCRFEPGQERPEGIARRNITFSPRNGSPLIVTDRVPSAAPVAV